MCGPQQRDYWVEENKGFVHKKLKLEKTGNTVGATEGVMTLEKKLKPKDCKRGKDAPDENSGRKAINYHNSRGTEERGSQ